MFLTDFKQIFADAKLIDEYFTDRDLGLAFNLSTTLHAIDTYNTEKSECLTLSFFEFVEAVARAAEKLALLPVGISKESAEAESWLISKRLTLPLCLKLEALFAHFMVSDLDKKMR